MRNSGTEVRSSGTDAPAHAANPSGGALRLAGALTGVAAIAVAVGVAVPTLLGRSAPAVGTITTARSLTVEVPAAAIPLSDADLSALLDTPADLGALTEHTRLTSCLAGLGYRLSTPVLGAAQVTINGRAAVVLLLAAEDPALLSALAVAPHCSAADTGLLADTTIPRP